MRPTKLNTVKENYISALSDHMNSNNLFSEKFIWDLKYIKKSSNEENTIRVELYFNSRTLYIIELKDHPLIWNSKINTYSVVLQNLVMQKYILKNEFVETLVSTKNKLVSEKNNWGKTND